MNSRTLAKKIQIIAILILVVATSVIVSDIFTSPVSAHEGRNVGDYNFVVGFIREPAYEGQFNAISLIVTRTTHQEHLPGHAPATLLDEAQERDTENHGTESHNHDTEETEAHQHLRDEEVDVLTHGAVFLSQGFRRGESFEFEITDEMKGIGIPYHIHPGDHQGTIIISDNDTHSSIDKTVTITKDGLDPKRLEANVGDTVVWINDEFQNAVVMSGPLESMSSGMESMIESGISSMTTEIETSTNRVTGLATTLRVELIHKSTDSSKEMPLTEVFDDPGHYIAEFIPTAPGDYRIRFFGSIEGNAVDENFDSGPNTFDTVVPSDSIQFPVVLESNRETQNAAQSALNTLQNLEADIDTNSSTASIGMIAGIIGTSIGILSLAISIFAIAVVRRRN